MLFLQAHLGGTCYQFQFRLVTNTWPHWMQLYLFQYVYEVLQSPHPQTSFVFDLLIYIAVKHRLDSYQIAFFEHVHPFSSAVTRCRVFLELADKIENSSISKEQSPVPVRNFNEPANKRLCFFLERPFPNVGARIWFINFEPSEHTSSVRWYDDKHKSIRKAVITYLHSFVRALLILVPPIKGSHCFCCILGCFVHCIIPSLYIIKAIDGPFQ